MSRAAKAAGVLALALAAWAGALFLPAPDLPWLGYDDDVYVTGNPAVRAGLSAPGVAWALTAVHASNWHPLTWMSHMLDETLFGPGSRGPHLVNVLLHAANASLLFLVLRGMTGAAWPSLLAAALFAVHPLHVESVAWVAERKDVLSTFFWLLAMGAYLVWVRGRGAAAYAATCLAMAAALMSKAMPVTLPFVLLLLDWWPLGRMGTGSASAVPVPASAVSVPVPRLILEKAPLLAMAAAASVITYAAQSWGGAVQSFGRLPWPLRVGNALVAYVRYLSKAAWPAGLTVHYAYPPAGLPSWRAAGAGLLLAALTWLAVGLARRRPYLGVGWLWYLGTLVPVIGLVQVGSQAMADRYTYVPLTGVFIAAAWSLAALAGGLPFRRRLAVPAAVALVLLLSWQTRVRLGDWASGETLFRRAAAVDPGDWVVLDTLGVILDRQGRYQEGEPLHLAAARINPRFPQAPYHLGLSLERRGRFAEAAAAYRRALEADPRHAASYNNLGFVLLRLGRTDEAVTNLRRALELNPRLAVAHTNLGNALSRLGRYGEAREQIAEGRRLSRWDFPGPRARRGELPPPP